MASNQRAIQDNGACFFRGSVITTRAGFPSCRAVCPGSVLRLFDVHAVGILSFDSLSRTTRVEPRARAAA